MNAEDQFEGINKFPSTNLIFDQYDGSIRNIGGPLSCEN